MKFKCFMLGVWTGAIILSVIAIWAYSKIEPPKPETVYVTVKDKMMIDLGRRERNRNIVDSKKK